MDIVLITYEKKFASLLGINFLSSLLRDVIYYEKIVA